MSKLIKLPTLKMCIFVYISYTSVKLLRNIHSLQKI